MYAMCVHAIHIIMCYLRCDGILIRSKLYSKQQQEVPVAPLGGKESARLYRREKNLLQKKHEGSHCLGKFSLLGNIMAP